MQTVSLPARSSKVGALPKRSPWGAVDGCETLAPGIVDVSTSSHGGIRLSPDRWQSMPDYMRSPDRWYEEDCEWALVWVVFGPDILKAALDRDYACSPIGDAHKRARLNHDAAWRTFAGWWPAQFTRFTGKALLEAGHQAKFFRQGGAR